MKFVGATVSPSEFFRNLSFHLLSRQHILDKVEWSQNNGFMQVNFVVHVTSVTHRPHFPLSICQLRPASLSPVIHRPLPMLLRPVHTVRFFLSVTAIFNQIAVLQCEQYH